jgi:hypothetical protein
VSAIADSTDRRAELLLVAMAVVLVAWLDGFAGADAGPGLHDVHDGAGLPAWL